MKQYMTKRILTDCADRITARNMFPEDTSVYPMTLVNVTRALDKSGVSRMVKMLAGKNAINEKKRNTLIREDWPEEKSHR